MITKDHIATGKKYVMNTYNQYPVVIEKGDGCYVWDTNGKKYLDFVAGIAVNSLGYGDEEYIQNLTEQLCKINHCSNLYFNLPQIDLAEMLIKNSCFDKVFFCNSGAEAIEAALKLSRKYGKKTHDSNCHEIITMKHSFHGRTLGAVTATGQEKYQKDLAPLLPGIKYAEFNNIDSVKELISDKTCAVLVEPIQGEGGIYPATKEFLTELRKICTEKDILLMFDEVQCGVGRTGKLFAYEIYGITPDVIAIAKGLGGGFPIGAMMAVQKAADAFQPGDHASTFGGNPLACTAGKTVISKLLNKGFLKNAETQGYYLSEKLSNLKDKFEIVKDIRGVGLMQGIEVTIPASDIVSKCMEKGLLLIGAGANVVRFVPPLTVTQTEINSAIGILTDALQEINNEG